MMKKLLAVIVVLLAAFGLLVAQAAAKKREFTGNVDIQIFQKDVSGQWKIADELHVSGVRFVTNVTDVAGKKSLATDFAFSGNTKKGTPVTVRLKPGGKGDTDLTTGFLALELPFDITIGGKKADASIKMTTDTVQGAAGTVSGRRAKLNAAAHTADLALVGSVNVLSPIVLSEGTMPAPATAGQVAEQKGAKAQERAGAGPAAGPKSQEALLVVKGDGTLKALN